MKTQLRKPARSKASYTDQYKQEALELWRASGRSAAKVAAELGIRPPLLYRWAHAEREPNAPQGGRKPRRSLEELEAENRRLRQENAKLLEQRTAFKASPCNGLTKSGSPMPPASSPLKAGCISSRSWMSSPGAWSVGP
jgi:transposase